MTNGPQDLENPNSSYRVGSCFTKTQSGSYFSGTGYAKAGLHRLCSKSHTKECVRIIHDFIKPWLCFNPQYLFTVSTYRVGNDVTVELEFRTSSSTGVLLGISSQIMDGLGLELVNGRVRARGKREWARKVLKKKKKRSKRNKGNERKE